MYALPQLGPINGCRSLAIEAVLDAAQIAGLNILRVMNEHTATTLAYGIYRSNDFDPEKPMTVAFLGVTVVMGSTHGSKMIQVAQSYPLNSLGLAAQRK